jgi:hypothetical protein
MFAKLLSRFLWHGEIHAFFCSKIGIEQLFK